MIVKMRINWNTKLVGPRVRLHPYRSSYVAKYHMWMTDEWLCEMTASEPQTLEEEYKLQQEWRDDNQKLTFIVFDESAPSDGDMRDGSVEGMIGDINLFMLDEDHAEDYLATMGMTPALPDALAATPCGTRVAELMVMIAEASARRKGYAIEAVRCMAKYARSRLGIEVLVVKITDSNISSIKLFERLGFVLSKELKPFEEVHYVLNTAGIDAIVAALDVYDEVECLDKDIAE